MRIHHHRQVTLWRTSCLTGNMAGGALLYSTNLSTGKFLSSDGHCGANFRAPSTRSNQGQFFKTSGFISLTTALISLLIDSISMGRSVNLWRIPRSSWMVCILHNDGIKYDQWCELAMDENQINKGCSINNWGLDHRLFFTGLSSNSLFLHHLSVIYTLRNLFPYSWRTNCVIVTST